MLTPMRTDWTSFATGNGNAGIIQDCGHYEGSDELSTCVGTPSRVLPKLMDRSLVAHFFVFLSRICWIANPVQRPRSVHWRAELPLRV